MFFKTTEGSHRKTFAFVKIFLRDQPLSTKFCKTEPIFRLKKILMDDIFRDIEKAEKSRRQFADTVNSTKYDLDKLLSEFMEISMKFYVKGTSGEEKIKFPIKEIISEKDGKEVTVPIALNVYDNLITIINTMYSSLIAPFHHYNNYIDYYLKDFLWDDLKYLIEENEPRDSNTLRRTKYQIEIQAMLMSLKAGLDRFISLFSYYYKGISPHTTFGRYKKDKDKFEGFMFTVANNKDTDQLMNFIYDNYFDWIEIAVAPRDTITHYNDLGIYYEFNSEIQGDVPVHYNERLIKEKGKEKTPVFIYKHDSIKEFTESWKVFIHQTFSALIEKELITYYPKF